MRIGIFDPYLDTLGGGEKYILTLAECLAKDNTVFFFWDNQETLIQGAKRFDIDITNIKTTTNIFSSKSFLEKLLETRNYDCIVYISDGSIPFLFAKKNILLFQFPVNWIYTKGLITKIKLRNISTILCYSQFVKNFLDKTFNRDSIILTPPISTPLHYAHKKENSILTVGRFTQGMNTKKQDVMIDVFKKMYKSGLKNWKLSLLGGVLPQDKDFVAVLREKAKGFPIEIHTNVSITFLQEQYAKAKIYWHAAGFGENLLAHPEFAEHFGITTVEAMSYGAVPVVIDAGGQPEIVENKQNGFLWKTENELIQKTQELIQDKKLWETMSIAAQQKSKEFMKEKFCNKVKSIIENT